MNSGRRIRLAAIAVLGVAMIGATTAVAPPAAAAPSNPATSSGTLAIDANKILFQVPRPVSRDGVVAPQFVPSVITCYGGAGGPVTQNMGSGVVGVVVGGVAYCDFPISSLDMTMLLYRNDNVWGSGIDWSTSSVGAAATGPCFDAAYHGKMIVRMLFPPGYTPAEATATRFTARVNIDCP